MNDRIIIVDYGMGNLNSVKKKLNRLKVFPVISSNPKDIVTACKIILPGVGHFLKAMENIKTLELLDALNEVVLVKQKPVLGICLGMQLMAKHSEEGDATGFGWFDSSVVRFKIKNNIKYKIPHMGWNQLEKKKDSILLKDIPDNSEFYFVHSYHWKTCNETEIISETEYEYPFPSSIEKNNIFGVQYHPEKSHDVGETLLRNFINL